MTLVTRRRCVRTSQRPFSSSDEEVVFLKPDAFHFSGYGVSQACDLLIDANSLLQSYLGVIRPGFQEPDAVRLPDSSFLPGSQAEDQLRAIDNLISLTHAARGSMAYFTSEAR